MLRDVVKIWCIFFSISDILHLVYWSCGHFDIHCTYIWFSYILMYVLSHISPCVASFLSVYTCFLYHVCNLLFLFHTKMPWWVLFKVFQKYRLSKSIMPWTLFLHSFSRVCVIIRFYCIQQVIMSLVIYDFLHTSFFVWFCMDCQRGRLLGDMWNLLEHMLL